MSTRALFAIAAIASAATAAAAFAQDLAGTIEEVPAWAGSLVLGTTTLQAEGSSTQEELPGLGHKFELFGSAEDAKDPENPTNDVISTDVEPGVFGGAVRNLPPGIKITALRNQLELKAYFTGGRTCGGGSPRIQLAVDTDGDGAPNGNAHGYFGPSPSFTPCPQNVWLFEDFTEDPGTEELEWDLTQFGGPFYNTWTQVEAFFTALYPNHQVLSGAIVDDTFLGSPGGEGRAYYDQGTIENRTLEQDQDTVKGK